MQNSNEFHDATKNCSFRVQPNERELTSDCLVRRTVEVCEKYERPVATYTQASEILSLRPFAC
jgi:hypothetical protein